MNNNDDLALAIIGAALIASKAVDVSAYDRELLNQIMGAESDVNRLLQLPAMRQLRTLAHAVHNVLCAAIDETTPPRSSGFLDDRQKCVHPSCECTTAMDEPHWPYCSEHCKEAGDETELRCDCQHAECRQASARTKGRASADAVPGSV